MIGQIEKRSVIGVPQSLPAILNTHDPYRKFKLILIMTPLSGICSLIVLVISIISTASADCDAAAFVNTWTVPGPFSETGTHTFSEDGHAVHYGALSPTDQNPACAYTTQALWSAVPLGSNKYNISITTTSCDPQTCSQDPCAVFPFFPLQVFTEVDWDDSCLSFTTPDYFDLTWTAIPICSENHFIGSFTVQGPGPEVGHHTFYSDGTALHTGNLPASGDLEACVYSTTADWSLVPNGVRRDQLTLVQTGCSNGTCTTNPCAIYIPPAPTTYYIDLVWDTACSDFTAPSFFDLTFVAVSSSTNLGPYLTTLVGLIGLHAFWTL